MTGDTPPVPRPISVTVCPAGNTDSTLLHLCLGSEGIGSRAASSSCPFFDQVDLGRKSDPLTSATRAPGTQAVPHVRPIVSTSRADVAALIDGLWEPMERVANSFAVRLILVCDERKKWNPRLEIRQDKWTFNELPKSHSDRRLQPDLLPLQRGLRVHAMT